VKQTMESFIYNNLSIDLQKEVTPPRIAHRRD